MNLGGGHDPIFATDPKTKAEVDRDIDVPYSANAIFQSEGRPFGPHWRPLRKHLSKIAVVNGVQMNTAGHAAGHMHFLRMKLGAMAGMPSILEIIGSKRDGQPLSSLSLGIVHASEEYSPQYFGVADGGIGGAAGPNPLDAVLGSDPDDLKRLAAVYRKHQASAKARGAAVTANAFGEIASLLEKVPSLRPYKYEPWETTGGPKAVAEHFQRALWALENDVTSGVFIVPGGNAFDSHTNNTLRQKSANDAYIPNLARFLDALEDRSNAYGKLIDNTVVIAGSELGRFPRINDTDGKDHFPQTSFHICGAGVAAGSRFGATNKQMAGLPMSLETGKPGSGRLVTIDDIGATMLTRAGLAPEAYGYRGDHLPFLFRA